MAEKTIDVSALLKDGWIYKDFPSMPLAAWEFIKEGIGKGNCHILAEAFRGKADTDGSFTSDKAETARGQLVISPAGRIALGRFKDEQRDRFNACFPAEAT